MITIVCATNRPGSNSLKVASIYARLFQEAGTEAQVLNLEEVNPRWIADSSYAANTMEMDRIVEQYIRVADKLVLVVPEYNGSFPGILKFFIDGCNHGDWANKKIALVGLTTGRSGNLRGLDHLTGIFHYLGSSIYWRKVYLSQVAQMLDSEGTLTDETALKELNNQMSGFLAF